MLDWYPRDDRDLPQPECFEESHSAFILLDLNGHEVDVEVSGSYLHADPSVGAPSGWRIETATVHSADPSLDGQDVTALLDSDPAALRRAEQSLGLARDGWLS